MKKLNIYVYVAENSGVGYYRNYLPAWVLRETGKANVVINDFRWGVGNHVEPTEKVFFQTCNWADIVIVGRHDRPEYYAKWGAAKEFFNIPVVMDTDDNVHHVRPSNPGYQGYHPGSEATKWDEYAMTKLFDGITVSTKNLQRYYEKFHPRIFTLPNNLDVKEWEKHPSGKKGKKIKMAFICSASHADGFGIIQKPVYDILKKYKNVEFYYPKMYDRLFEKAPEEIKKQLKQIDWIKLKDWPRKLKKLGFDIGLAPLKDNMFNRGKSNLRYLEYALAGMVPIVSPVEPYKMVNDGKDGFVAKEGKDWYNVMEKLIGNEELRLKISYNAYKRVAKEFNIWENIDKWLETYKEIHKKYHSFYGPKKLFMPLKDGKYQEILDKS